MSESGNGDLTGRGDPSSSGSYPTRPAPSHAFSCSLLLYLVWSGEHGVGIMRASYMPLRPWRDPKVCKLLFFYLFKPSFLSLGIGADWGWIIVCGGAFLPIRVFSSDPSLHPPVVSCTPPQVVTTKNVSIYVRCPLGEDHALPRPTPTMMELALQPPKPYLRLCESEKKKC